MGWQRFELLYDSTERERRGLALRRMYRTIAPWVTENPVLMHVRSAAPEAVKAAIDQCAAVGFEMVILTFGSGFDFESSDPKYQAATKELADYGRSKGVALGSYSLLASRGAGTAADNTQGAPARFGVLVTLRVRNGEHVDGVVVVGILVAHQAEMRDRPVVLAAGERERRGLEARGDRRRASPARRRPAWAEGEGAATRGGAINGTGRAGGGGEAGEAIGFDSSDGCEAAEFAMERVRPQMSCSDSVTVE